MFKLHFTFDDREQTCLSVINQALQGMPFSRLSMGDFSGFLATTRHFAPSGSVTSVERWYGFENIEFECEPDADGHVYQLAAIVSDETQSEAFRVSWAAANPAKVMRSMTVMAYGDSRVYLILWHERA